jgi:hypothetical protein
MLYRLTALSCLSWLSKVNIDGYYRHFTLNIVAYSTRPDEGEVLAFFQGAARPHLRSYSNSRTIRPYLGSDEDRSPFDSRKRGPACS